VAVGVWLLVARSGLAPAPAAAESPKVDLAHAFTSAWNVRDAASGASLFARDAQIRQRDARVVQHGANVDVSDVYGSALSYEGDPPRVEGDEVVWATGGDEIRTWFAGLPPLPPGQPVETANHRVTGTTVAWDYRVPVPSSVQRVIPGLQPFSGTAEAEVTGGRISRLTLLSTPGTAAQREQARARALAAAFPGTEWGTAPNARNTVPRTPDTQARTIPSTGPGLLALTGLAATACLAAFAKR